VSKYERIINEDGEIGYFVPEIVEPTIRTKDEMDRARYFSTLPTKKRFHNGRRYFISYNEAVESLIQDLTLIEAGALVKLLLCLKLNNGGLLTKGDKPLNKTDIARILGRSRPATNAIVERLFEFGVLESIEDSGKTYYRINSRYHTMGEALAKTVFTKVYITKARDIIDSLKLNEIGMLYKIIPYFHFTEYYLCVNADSDRESIEYMGRESLASAIGHDVATVSKLMAKLQSAGALLVTGSKNESRYLINPDLMFRQGEGDSTDWTWAVRKMFADHEKKARP